MKNFGKAKYFDLKLQTGSTVVKGIWLQPEKRKQLHDMMKSQKPITLTNEISKKFDITNVVDLVNVKAFVWQVEGAKVAPKLTVEAEKITSKEEVSEIDQWSNEIEKHIEEADQTIGLLEQWLNDTQVKREDLQ
ncbi:Hypothetical predicted protein [Paramuricea clavata]|uniref:Uncharacterized protein n=1 Tax=Paramuricea clavata TaxID=317549 RepID=A0A6S7HDK6_PARCT|nr:Hypothetical predicted protein [Paramuricea clavata]